MFLLSPSLQLAFADYLGWPLWSALVGIIGLLLLLIYILDKQLPQVATPQALDDQSGLLRLIDWLYFLTLMLAIGAAWFLPAFQLTDPRTPIVCAVVGTLLAIAFLFFPPFYKSAVGLRWGTFLLTLLEVLAAASAMVSILSLPPRLVTERNWILTNLVFCGGLTLYRETRRRWQSGDRSWASQIGGFLVVVQFLSLISLVAVPLTLFLIVIIALNGLLAGRDPIKAWLELVVFLLSTISVVYLLFYRTRRLMGARGFSWVDPPNWRVALPHLKYLIGLKRSFPFIGAESTLADQVRKAYIRAIVGDEPIAEAARIWPLLSPHTPTNITFAVIGDPGEGDDSLLYPGTQRGASKQVAGQMLQSGSTESTFLEDRVERPLDFVIISSDVVYPAGEMMDYERAVYRPYTSENRQPDMPANPQASVPIYAIPGNHDWYDDLRGFLANFTYAAHNGDGRAGRGSPHDMPWDWRPWRHRLWEQVAKLREDYDLKTLGGLPELKETQQRLSFFELELSGAPLTVLALDNGVTGAIDDVQYAWLEERLQALRAPGREIDQLILVLVGNPLYAEGTFAGWKTPQEDAGPAEARGLREIYELLREYRVDVVMGGNTHAYQRYESIYTDSDGTLRTMHHVVNGGGGAYLSWPMDAGWVKFEWSPTWKLKLNRRNVYQAQARQRASDDPGADEVILHDLFPTVNDIIDKFAWSAPAEDDSWMGRQRTRFRQWYNTFVLDHGLTNALDHDQLPLLQSYVTVEMDNIAPGQWELRIVPWFSLPHSSKAEAQRARQLVLRTGKGDWGSGPSRLVDYDVAGSAITGLWPMG
jgi:hypothetical protein